MFNIDLDWCRHDLELSLYFKLFFIKLFRTTSLWLLVINMVFELIKSNEKKIKQTILMTTYLTD